MWFAGSLDCGIYPTVVHASVEPAKDSTNISEQAWGCFSNFMCSIRGFSPREGKTLTHTQAHAHSENPNLRLRSRLELWSLSWHGWFLEQSFLVRNLFYNDTFFDVLFRDWNGDRKSSRCLPNTSTFLPNDPSQCLYCVLPIMRCTFGAHLDVGLAERRTPCRFVGNLTFPFLFLGEDGRLW